MTQLLATKPQYRCVLADAQNILETARARSEQAAAEQLLVDVLANHAGNGQTVVRGNGPTVVRVAVGTVRPLSQQRSDRCLW